MDRDFIVLDDTLADMLMLKFFEGDLTHYPKPDFYTIKQLEHCVLLEARMDDLGVIYSTNINKDLNEPVVSTYKIEDWRVTKEFANTTKTIKKIACATFILLSLLTCVVLNLMRKVI